MASAALDHPFVTVTRAAAGAGGQLVTAAFPFVPAVLGLEHFASTYLPADLLHRATRFLGGSSRLGSATDVHSVQVSSDGKSRAGADELCDAYDCEYRRHFTLFGVEFDVFFRTDDQRHVSLTHAALRRLDEVGHLIEGKATEWRCGGCDARPPDRLLKSSDGGVICPWCEAALLERVTSNHLLLDLEPMRPDIETGVVMALPEMRRRAEILKEPLGRWCVTRNQEVGMPMHVPRPGQSLYLWFESLVGYRSLLDACDWPEPEREAARLRHFFGKNIFYHHAILWPAIARHGLSTSNPIEALVRGFARGNCGWAAAHYEDPALRPFALLRVPDRSDDFQLDEREFTLFRKRIWHNKYMNLLHRLSLNARAPDGPLPMPRQWLDAAHGCFANMLAAATNGHSRALAHEIDSFLRFNGRYCVQHAIPWSDDPDLQRQAWVVRASCASLLLLLSPRADRELAGHHAVDCLADLGRLVAVQTPARPHRGLSSKGRGGGQ